MFIDIHCHLELLKDANKVVKDAKKKNVKIILTNGVDRETNRKSLEFSNKFPEVKACLGIYPIDALKISDKEIEEEIKFIEKDKNKIIAIGEVGIDFKEDSTQHKRQEEIFEKFIKLSMKINKPIIVHSRKAESKCIEILERLEAKKVLMHCFFGEIKLVDRIVKNNWYLSIPTCVVYNEQMKEVVRRVDIDKLLCETDSPYMHPKREWPNEPANVVESYKKISEIKGISLKEVEKIIEKNYKRLFL